MRHLTAREFVELIDGVLPPARAAHVEACEPCRAAAAELRETLDGVGAGDVPEPSPLFWEHLSARVDEAIAAEASGAGSHARWRPAPAVAWAASALVATMILALVFGRALLPGNMPRSGGDVDRAAVAASPPSSVPAPDERLAEVHIDEDDAWVLVRVVAEEATWETADAAGVAAAPGTAERLALELSESERVELARLIETELKGSGV